MYAKITHIFQDSYQLFLWLLSFNKVWNKTNNVELKSTNKALFSTPNQYDLGYLYMNWQKNKVPTWEHLD